MIDINYNLCDVCGTCASVCPVNAIEIFEKYITINNETCTLCRNCVEICPVEALTLTEETTNVER